MLGGEAWAQIFIKYQVGQHKDFPGGTSGKEPTCQCRRCRRHGFDPWVGKVPWRRKWQPSSVFLPGKYYGQKSLVGYSPWGHKELNMMSMHTQEPLDT